MVWDTIFGQKQHIEEEELTSFILNLREDATTEFKSISDGIQDQSWKEKQLIKPIVGFLNAIPKGGRLVLGVIEKKQKPTEVVGIDKKIIRNAAWLSSVIYDNIAVIPHQAESFHLGCVEYQLESGRSLYFIEVYTDYQELFFYSTITNIAYQRHGERTEALALSESLSIINKRRSAFLTLHFEGGVRLNKPHGYRYGIVLENGGTKPSEGYAIVLTVTNAYNCAIGFRDTQTNYTQDPAESATFQYKTKEAIYPLLKETLGFIDLHGQGEDFKFDITTEIFNETHRITQQASYDHTNGELHLEEMEVTKLSYLDKHEM